MTTIMWFESVRIYTTYGLRSSPYWVGTRRIAEGVGKINEGVGKPVEGVENIAEGVGNNFQRFIRAYALGFHIEREIFSLPPPILKLYRKAKTQKQYGELA